MFDGQPLADALAQRLREHGLTVFYRRRGREEPTLLHQAIVEAELLAELSAPDGIPTGQEQTYRLLIGVLLRDREELQQLREHTISPLAAYDSEHDTELVATLLAFFAHHGSTTETADAMSLHRHTVGYRLSRVHEVSGLLPGPVLRTRAAEPRLEGRTRYWPPTGGGATGIGPGVGQS